MPANFMIGRLRTRSQQDACTSGGLQWKSYHITWLPGAVFKKNRNEPGDLHLSNIDAGEMPFPAAQL